MQKSPNPKCEHEGALRKSFSERLTSDQPAFQRLATACICNLSADPLLKDAIAKGGAIPYLSRLLESDEESGTDRIEMWDEPRPGLRGRRKYAGTRARECTCRC